VPWTPIVAWIAVVVFALVILGYCGYELAWKARRLQRDLAGLADLGRRAEDLNAQAATLQQRLAGLDAR
jgi:hypothetical protein